MKVVGKRMLALVLAWQLAIGAMMADVSYAGAASGSNAGTPYDGNGAYDVNVQHVIINQAYGAGLVNDDGVLVSHGFIELYNPTSSEVVLDGWALHYADRGSNANGL